MVLNDAELDALWRTVGSFRGKHREHLEVAIENEQTLFSTVTERLFREYRDLKALHEQADEAFDKLKRDYVLRVQALDERTAQLMVANKKIDELNRQVQGLQQKLMHR